MNSNSEEIISITSDLLNTMYVSLGKLVEVKANIHTLKNFIHTMEMLDQSWLKESNQLPRNIGIPYTESCINYGREMISIPQQLYENAVIEANHAIGKLAQKEQRIAELESMLQNQQCV